jgi:hypothetical protein
MSKSDRSVETVFAEFEAEAAIQSDDIVLSIATAPQREPRLRCVIRTDPVQGAMLDRLGFRLPERLRILLA